MKKFLALLLFFTTWSTHAQVEVNLYTTVAERIGAGVEYFPSLKTGIELEGSFWRQQSSNFFINADVKNQESDLYLTGSIKRYTKSAYDHGFFYGGFLRYHMNFSTIIDEQTWTPEQMDFASTNETWRSTRKHRISMGGLVGYKAQINNRFNVAINLGIGSAISASYWQTETKYDFKEIKSSGVKDEYLSNLSLLTGFGQISIGYKFLRSCKTCIKLIDGNVQ